MKTTTYTPLDYEAEARYTDLPEGSLAVCRYCQSNILLDQQEGGGPGKDWGAALDGGSAELSWSLNGGPGLDYGCDQHPLTDDEGTWGHVPDFQSIRVQS